MTDASDTEDTGSGAMARIKGAKDEATGLWARIQARYGWLRHVLESFALLTRNNGNQYAAAITYFSFLALFPLLLLAVSITGYILFAHPSLQASLFAHVTDKVPGSFGKTLKSSLQTAIDNRAGVGIIGLVGVLLTGLGWIGNLRQAIDAVWGQPPAKKNFLMSRVSNMLVLGGLGLGVLVSLGLTVVGTSLTTQIVSALGIDDIPGSTILLKVLGIAIAAVGDMIIFWWLLIRLPGVVLDRKLAFSGVLLAAIGFEILKIVGTYTIAHASQSATAGPFASIIAVLVWIQLVTRFELFCCAWMSVANVDVRSANSVPIIEPAVMVDERPAAAPGVTPATVGATLVGAGALAGAVATWAATRPRPDRHNSGD